MTIKVAAALPDQIEDNGLYVLTKHLIRRELERRQAEGRLL